MTEARLIIPELFCRSCRLLASSEVLQVPVSCKPFFSLVPAAGGRVWQAAAERMCLCVCELSHRPLETTSGSNWGTHCPF